MKKIVALTMMTLLLLFSFAGYSVTESVSPIEDMKKRVNFGDPIKISMDLSKNTFTGPETIEITITVWNSGEWDMPGPVNLYFSNGTIADNFGSPVLPAGGSQIWHGSWKVTEIQLELEKIQFIIKYPVYDTDGQLINKTKIFSKRIYYDVNPNALIDPDGPEDEIHYIGDYSYSYNEDRTVKIVEVLNGIGDETEGYLVNFEEGAMNYIPSFINDCPVTEIGDDALRSLKLQSWTVPGTVRKIGSGAFSHSEVETIIMEEGVEELGDKVFENMIVANITIPSTVSKMGDNPFVGCLSTDIYSIPDITLSPENTHFRFQDHVLFSLDECRIVYFPCADETREQYRVPDETKVIGAHAFDGSRIKQIILSDGVTEIGEYAFTCSHLQSLQLPEHLKVIKDGAFYGCNDLTTVTIPASVTEFGEDVFLGCESICLMIEDNDIAEQYALENGLRFIRVRNDQNEDQYPDNNGNDDSCITVNSWEDALNGICCGIRLGSRYDEVIARSPETFEIVPGYQEWNDGGNNKLIVDYAGRITDFRREQFNFDDIHPGSSKDEVIEKFGEPTDWDDSCISYYGNKITDDGAIAIVDFYFDSAERLTYVWFGLGF